MPGLEGLRGVLPIGLALHAATGWLLVAEAALNAINELPDTPFFLAALLWRLNDWVEPVRRAAEVRQTRITSIVN